MNSILHPVPAAAGDVQPFDPKVLRNCLSRFATGVTVVSALSDDGPHGLTVNSFASVSLDPPLVLVCIDRQSKAVERLIGRRFAINILSAEQEDLARHFAGDRHFERIDWQICRGAPTLAGTLARIWCRPASWQEMGDHVVLVGEVTDFQSDDLDALTFFGGHFSRLPNIAPA